MHAAELEVRTAAEGEARAVHDVLLESFDPFKGLYTEEAYNITIPSDIDPGLTYGILFLDWSIYRTLSWQKQWDKASFRATYVKNKDYENLQTSNNSILNELQNTRTLTYALFATTIALTASTACSSF